MVGEADGFSCYSSGKCVEFVASSVLLLVTMDTCTCDHAILCDQECCGQVKVYEQKSHG